MVLILVRYDVMWLDYGWYIFWKVNEFDIYKYVYIGVVVKKKIVFLLCRYVY